MPQPLASQRFHRVGQDPAVASYQGQIVRERLRDQHAIKGIAVVRRQPAQTRHVTKVDRKLEKTMTGHLLNEVIRCVELANGAFDLYLPRGYHADQDGSLRPFQALSQLRS